MADLNWITSRIERAQDRHRRRFEDLYRHGAIDPVMVLGGPPWGRDYKLWARQRMDMLDNPRGWIDQVLADMDKRREMAADESIFCPLYISLDAMGVHFIDALLGAHVYEHEGDIWNDPLEVDLGDLKMPDLDRSPVMAKWLELARQAVQAGGGRIPAAFVGTSCPINVGMNVLGQGLLEALIISPDDARHALRVMADVIKGVIARALRVIPEPLRVMGVAYNRYAPSGYGFVDGCATQLLSPGHYAEFFAPLDAEILSLHRNGGMIHLCGASAQHIPAWRAMTPLASVQLNDRAADDFELYFNGLREDQLIYVAPTAGMSVQRILKISGGRRVVIQTMNDQPVLPRSASQSA